MTEGLAGAEAAGDGSLSNYDVVILQARGDSPEVAAAAGSDVFALPRVAVDGEPETSTILAAVVRLMGERHPPPLRIVSLGVIGARPGLALVELEPVRTADAAGAGTPPPGGLTWRTLTPSAIESVEPELARPYLGRWLAELGETPTGPGRPPWSQPGWLARVSAWMADRLAENGIPLVAAPQIHYLWGLSAVLRGETAGGSVFLKACSRIFPTEVAITRTLAAANPERLPTVIAGDAAENWLLMGDLGASFIGDGPVARWPEGLVAHAAIQRRWLHRVDELAAAGFERRGLAELAGQIPALPDLPLLAPMGQERLGRLRTAIPRLVEACARLAAIGPGDTIVHGDLHPWNVADVDGRSIVFDWSDSCIGHPFLDLVTYVGRTADVATRRACVDAYLEAWSDVADRPLLEEAVALALPLGALHQVESYRRILAGLAEDDRWDLAEAGPSHAEHALEWLEEGLAAGIKVHE
jgi:phosphotransferase family enzyme